MFQRQAPPHRRRRRHHHHHLAEMLRGMDDGVQLPENAASVDLATPQLEVSGPTYDQLCGLSSTKRRLIATTPAGQAALLAHDNASQAQKLHKLKGHPDPKVRNAADTLHAAKKGDPKARKKIALVHEAARQGHPEGVAAMRRLHAVNDATNHRRGPLHGEPHPGHGPLAHFFHNISDAFKHGGTRFAG